MLIGEVKDVFIGENKGSGHPSVLTTTRLTQDADVQTVEFLSPFGEDTTPVPGTLVFVAQVSSSLKFALATKPTETPQSAPGEKRLFSLSADGTQRMTLVHFKNTGEIELSNENGSFTLFPDGRIAAKSDVSIDFDAPVVNFTGDINMASGSILGSSVFNGASSSDHVHIDAESRPTSAPTTPK